MATHLGERVRYPQGMRPGDLVEWIEGDRVRSGVVIDRAANGIASQPGGNNDPWEASGYWLWVQPDDGPELVRVRYYARGRDKGRVERDDGPMYVRSMVGRNRAINRGHWYDIGDWLSGQTYAPCQCCEVAHAS